MREEWMRDVLKRCFLSEAHAFSPRTLRLLYLTLNKKIAIIGVALLFIGLTLVGLTVYQELVEEPKPTPEEYHMQIPTAKYQWRSRSVALSISGIVFVAFGLGFLLVGLTRKTF